MSQEPRSAPPPRSQQQRARTVSWFPGHMHKAQQRLARELAHVDVVLEMRDARLPRLSGNPHLERLIGGRRRLLLLNKSALADPAASRRWLAYFRERGLAALLLDADSRKGLNLLWPALRDLLGDTGARFRRRGIRPPQQRLMVVGMPNVGKSTLINRLARKKRLQTAPMPGITRGVSWVQLNPRTLLMDTPGMMLPRIDDEDDAFHLGWIGTLRDEIIGIEPLAVTLLAWLLEDRFDSAARRYDLRPEPGANADTVLDALCHKRNALLPGGAPDRHKMARALLDDFRAGRLGRFTLEAPD